MLGFLGWCGAGLALTPLVEYGWHAWLGHARRPRPTRREHLEHHRTAHTYATPWQEMGENAGRIGVTLLGVNLALGPLIGLRRSVPLTLGLVGGYVLTTLYHARMHQRAPASDWERWMWRFHMHHHYQDARVNFGLTSPLFDFVFGTAHVPTEVRIPRAAAPVWMTAEQDGMVFRTREA